MVEPNLPMNQIRALPIQNFITATPGQVIEVGQTVTRYWSPAALGMPANFVNVGTASILKSSLLDLTGCNKFVLVIARTLAAAGGDVADTNEVLLLFQNSAGGEDDPSFAFSTRQRGQRILNYAAMGAPFPRTDVWSLGWSVNVIQAGAGGGGGGLASIGRQCKVAIWNGTNNANANQSYSVELWGSQ